MPKLVLTKAFLWPAKAAAMCMAPHAETRPPPPIPPFLQAQNLSSKWIVPTDNMWLKLKVKVSKFVPACLQKEELLCTLVWTHGYTQACFFYGLEMWLIDCSCCSLTKKGSWAEHFTSLPKREVGALSTVSAFNHRKAPTSCLQRLDALEAKKQRTTESPAALKSSPDGTQHSERHDVTVSIVQLAVLTALATSFYTKIPCNNFGELRRFLPEICIALEAVLLKFHAKLAPGWALIRANFHPVQEIGPKVGCGHSFVSGPFFARLRYIYMVTAICMTCKASLCLFVHSVLQLGKCRHYEASLSKLQH